MIIKQLELRTESGSQLFLFDVQTDSQSDYLSAQVYLAQRNFPALTTFTVKAGAKPVQLQIREPVSEGLWSNPGDDKHFGRLEEPLLLLLVNEVTYGDEKSGA